MKTYRCSYNPIFVLPVGMNLNDYHTFVIVVKQQTITGAATLLGIPKSTVSRRLETTRSILNVELFTRSPKRIVLTQMVRLCMIGLSVQ